MRMWGVDPRLMCTQHLRGEHVEMHMIVGTINKGKSIRGYVNGGLMEVHNIRKRHDEIVKELERRGRWHHKSPLPEFEEMFLGKVNVEANKLELARRCERCRKIQEVGI